MTITAHLHRTLPDKAHMRITAQLRLNHPSLSDGFSVTADCWEARGNRSGRQRMDAGVDIDSGGSMHEQILHYAPKLAPLVNLHLADPDGVPMHAIANGWYFYSGRASAYERRQIAIGRDYGCSRLLEVSDHDRAARALRVSGHELPKGMLEDDFIAFAEWLRPRWKREAQEARALLERLADDTSAT